MAAVASHLADTSALARLRHPAVAEVLGPLIEAGLVATCGVIEFELRWATRTSAELDELRADREAGYEWLATHDEDWRRALQTQAALWRGGQTRSVGLPDLLVRRSRRAGTIHGAALRRRLRPDRRGHRPASPVGRASCERALGISAERQPQERQAFNTDEMALINDILHARTNDGACQVSEGRTAS